MAGNSSSENDFILLVIGIFVVLLIGLGIIMIFVVMFFEYSAKKKLKEPVNREPIIPFSQEGLYEFKGNNKIKNIIPEARIQCDSEVNNIRYPGQYEVKKIDLGVIQKMNTLMDSLFNLNERAEDEYEWIPNTHSSKLKPKISVPDNARTISIKMENFKHGLRCHDFEPIDGISPGSYYTHQMFGDNRIQVTNYVENGISYVAGFCIYIKKSKTDYEGYYSVEVIKDCLLSRKYQIGQSKKKENLELSTQEETAWNFSPEIHEALINGNPTSLAPYNKSIHKYCTRYREETLLIVKDDKVFHENFHSILKVVVLSECKQCTDELYGERPPNYSSMFAV